MYNVHVVSLFSTHTYLPIRSRSYTYDAQVCLPFTYSYMQLLHMNLQGGMTLRMLFTHYNSSHVYKCQRISYTSLKKCPPDEQVRDRYSRWKTSRCAYPQDAQWLLSTFLDPTTSPALRPCTIAYPARCELNTFDDSASTSCNTPKT